ncbi:MAG: metal-dependent hydrolase [Hyphomicrobiaceae bacterium]
MDSVTQATLGAAIGEAVLGRKIGNKAALYGAIVATLPDLDVFVPMGGPVADFTYHRGASHSLVVLTVITPVIATALHKFRRDPPDMRRSWFWLVFLALITHPLLDAFTIYGTQLFWPLSSYPFGLGSIFIIDPLFTLPVLIGLLIALISSRTYVTGHRANACGLAAGAAYLAWTVFAQIHANGVAKQSLTAEGVSYDRLLTIASPFNTLLWRSIATGRGGEMYYVGYNSLVDGSDAVAFNRFPAGQRQAEALNGHWPADRMRWFTKGFYRARLEDTGLVMTDLRMGVEGRYAFSFKVADILDGVVQPSLDQRIPPVRTMHGAGVLWDRIWDANVTLVTP